MISLDNIALSHGSQILYTGASMNLFAGEKVGLVGPNGAGKSTIFRMIVGEEQPDEGRVAVERGVTIGYFDQDVGEMSGRTVLAEVMAGAGEVSELAGEVKALEDAMGDPARADELDKLVERYGEVQSRFAELGGFELEPRAQEILADMWAYSIGSAQLGLKHTQLDHYMISSWGDAGCARSSYRRRITALMPSTPNGSTTLPTPASFISSDVMPGTVRQMMGLRMFRYSKHLPESFSPPPPAWGSCAIKRTSASCRYRTLSV